MAKKGYRIALELKTEILRRVKEEGVPIAQVAQEHGISDRTVYGWLTKGVTDNPSLAEITRLKRENKVLLELVGEITLKLSETQKKNWQ